MHWLNFILSLIQNPRSLIILFVISSFFGFTLGGDSAVFLGIVWTAILCGYFLLKKRDKLQDGENEEEISLWTIAFWGSPEKRRPNIFVSILAILVVVYFCMSGFSAFLEIIVCIFIGYIYLKKKVEKLAKEVEIKEKTDFEKKTFNSTQHGLVFGGRQEKLFIKPEDKDGHALVIGGSGRGKTSCIAIPSLWLWRKSVFAIDIKGDLHKNTKDKRDDIKVFDPLDDESFGYDPFHALKLADDQVQEMQVITQALIPLPAEKDPFWALSARDMLTGALLHYYNEGCSFIEAMETISSTPVSKLIKEVRNSKTEECVYFMNSFVDLSEATLSSIYKELSNHITLFATDKKLKKALSKKHCLMPSDLEEGSDVYIKIPEYLLEQWANFLTLLVSQFLDYFKKLPDMSSRPILFLLDEFARLGKFDNIAINGLATLRSKKITICLIIQSLAQLDYIYGKSARTVICDNCDYTAIFSAIDGETQKVFSERVGTHEIIKVSKNTSYGSYPKIKTGSSVSEAPSREPTIRQEEFATLEDIVLLTPDGFFRVEKQPYYLWK